MDASTSFTDFANRTWTVQLDVLRIGQIRRDLGVDLLDAEDYLNKLPDPCTLVSVLYALLADQIAEQQLSEVEFARGLQGDSLLQATLALWGALEQFLPAARGEQIRRLRESLLRADSLSLEEAGKLLDQLEGSLDRLERETTDAADGGEV